MSRYIFITTRKQHKPVKCMKLCTRFHIHGHNIPGRSIISMPVFAQADGASAIPAELYWDSACLQNTCPNRLRQLFQMHMSCRSLTPCILDADSDTMNIIVIIPNGFGKRSHSGHLRLMKYMCIVIKFSHFLPSVFTIYFSILFYYSYMLNYIYYL